MEATYRQIPVLVIMAPIPIAFLTFLGSRTSEAWTPHGYRPPLHWFNSRL